MNKKQNKPDETNKIFEKKPSEEPFTGTCGRSDTLADIYDMYIDIYRN